MKLRLFLVLILPAFAQVRANVTTTVYRTTAELNALRLGDASTGGDFDLTGVVALPKSGRGLVLRDVSGFATLVVRCAGDVATGDVVRATGYAYQDVLRGGEATAYAIRRVGRAATPEAVAATVAEIVAGKFDNRVVRVVGTAVDVAADEIDGDFLYVMLSDGGKTIPLSYHHPDADLSQLKKLTGARIEVVGFCNAASGTYRRFHARGINVQRALTRVVAPPPADPFAVPKLRIHPYMNPDEIFALGRQRAEGTVLVAWGCRNILVKTANGRLVRARLADDGTLPSVGSHIQLVGYPETDLFNVNLSSAVWRRESGKALPPEKPVAASAHDILPRNSKCQVTPNYHGRLVRLRGCVREILPAEGGQELRLSCDGEPVRVDASACGGLPDDVIPGTAVEVTGICLMESSDWRPAAPFPRIRGFFLVVRSSADIAVLSRPPWWTPARLGVVCLALFAGLVGIFIWNRWLQRLVMRRSHQLLRSEIGKAEATLRVDERTRLAVELHDTLSQNLTAVSFQIAASASTLGEDPSAAAGLLAKADRMLKSCRTELKNCLFDLRGDALEDPDFTTAISKTLAPYEHLSDIAVRFNVPRAKCSDTTTHAILRIVRELVANAIRHGGAKSVRVAGEWDEGELSFSVRDDGCGFDTAATPGIREGHFGLTGVRERVKQLGGTFSVESTPGMGVHAVVRLKLPQSNGKKQ